MPDVRQKTLPHKEVVGKNRLDGCLYFGLIFVRGIAPADDGPVQVDGHRRPDFTNIMYGIPASRGGGGDVGHEVLATGDLNVARGGTLL